jgi:hypothetical protein
MEQLANNKEGKFLLATLILICQSWMMLQSLSEENGA